jgi:dihydroneopterin aldolase
MSVTVEIHGFQLHGRHGVGAEERDHGQIFVFDVVLDVPEPAQDTIGATVDYRAVRDVLIEVSDARAYRLLESLAGAVADAILTRFDVQTVRVRVRKLGIAWAEWTAATSTRSKQ